MPLTVKRSSIKRYVVMASLRQPDQTYGNHINY